MEQDKLNDHLKQVFAYWVIEGNMYPSVLAAFYSILEYSGDEAPRQTMLAWVEFAKELASEDLKMPISTLDFLNIDLSVELEHLDIEESFFRLYDLSNKQEEAHKIARVRLSLIAIVGEDRQRQWVEKFNERIAPYKAELKRQPALKNDKKTKKKGFFDLGIAFAQFNVNTEDRLKFNHRAPVPSFIKEDIVEAIARMLEEASVCYENQCYTVTIMLYGKIIETLVKNVYKHATGKEIYTINKHGEPIERTFKQMCYDLRTEGMLLSKGTGELLDLIYAYRSGATHETLILNQDAAYCIALLTHDAMNRIFEHFNTAPKSESCVCNRVADE